MVNQDNSRLERLLRGINTEVKLLALLALDKERPQTGFDIRRQLRERIDDDSLVPAQNSFETVCRDCLRPSGAVQETKKVSGTGKRQKRGKIIRANRTRRTLISASRRICVKLCCLKNRRKRRAR